MDDFTDPILGLLLVKSAHLAKLVLDGRRSRRLKDARGLTHAPKQCSRQPENLDEHSGNLVSALGCTPIPKPICSRTVTPDQRWQRSG